MTRMGRWLPTYQLLSCNIKIIRQPGMQMNRTNLVEMTQMYQTVFELRNYILRLSYKVIILNPPELDHQAMQKHSAEHQQHHPCSIAEVSPSNYFVRPTSKSSNAGYKLRNYTTFCAKISLIMLNSGLAKNFIIKCMYKRDSHKQHGWKGNARPIHICVHQTNYKWAAIESIISITKRKTWTTKVNVPEEKSSNFDDWCVSHAQIQNCKSCHHIWGLFTSLIFLFPNKQDPYQEEEKKHLHNFRFKDKKMALYYTNLFIHWPNTTGGQQKFWNIIFYQPG